MKDHKIYFLIKFFLSGGLSAVTLYALLFLFHLYFNLGVVIASTLSYALSIAVGFSAQKYWTFLDKDHKKVPMQFSKYATLGVFNIGMNALFMHQMVEVYGIHYTLAQFISLVIITAWSFFFYRKYVFRQSSSEYKLPVEQ